MRPVLLTVLITLAASGSAFAQTPPAAPSQDGPKDAPKKNANPCRDEVAAALAKLRKSSWFRMDTTMITEKGISDMVIQYVLPDKMHQKVTDKLTNTSSEVILIGEKAWANQGEGWEALPNDVMNTLRTQMYENVVQEQTEVGEYACKGKVQVEGRDAFSYKLEQERTKDDSGPANEAFRMFYVDAITGMPVSTSLLAPGRENAPLFKATYAFPLDMKIEPPKDVKAAAPSDTKADPKAAPAPDKK